MKRLGQLIAFCLLFQFSATAQNVAQTTLLPETKKIQTLISEENWKQADQEVQALYSRLSKSNEDSLLLEEFERIIDLYTKKNHYVEAIQWLFYLNDSLCTDELGRCLNVRRRLSALYRRVEDYDNAIAIQQENLRLLKADTSKLPAYAETCNSIANMYFATLNRDSCIHYSKLALEIQRQRKAPKGVAHALNNLGFYYEGFDSLEIALATYKEGLTVLSKLPATTAVKGQIALIKGNMGALLMKLGNVTEALPLLYEDMRENFKSNNDASALNAGYELATYYSSLNDNRKAIDLLHECLEKTHLREDDYQLAKIYEQLFKSYLQLNNSQKATHYFNLYNALKNKNIEEQLQVNVQIEKGLLRNILESQVKYQEKIAQVRTREKDVLEQSNQLYRRQFWIVGITLLILLFVVIYNYRRRLAFLNVKKVLAENELQLEKLEHDKKAMELHYKSKDLTDFAMDISRKQEVLETIREQLADIKKKHLEGDALNAAIVELMHYATSNMNIDQQLNEFQTNIDEVNAKFFDLLKQQFPQLTDLDTQICALIRLGLSNKEIAVMRNVSYKAVRMSRYRIRKKLNLEEEDDIIDFLKGIA